MMVVEYRRRTGRILFYDIEGERGELIPDKFMSEDSERKASNKIDVIKFVRRSFSQEVTFDDMLFYGDNKSSTSHEKRVLFDTTHEARVTRTSRGKGKGKKNRTVWSTYVDNITPITIEEWNRFRKMDTYRDSEM